MTETEKKCSICGTTFVGWGNNPQPFDGDHCCDDCNGRFVIPARLINMGKAHLSERDLALLRYFAQHGRMFAGFEADHRTKELIEQTAKAVGGGA